jgi:serine/threonine protein kinase
MRRVAANESTLVRLVASGASGEVERMDRLEKIESLFQEALRRPVAERETWLRHTCGADRDLFREVSTLVSNHDPDSLDAWPALAVTQLMVEPALLPSGHHLGPYEIVSFLAAGGMGAVYRARDPRTGRDVAIKTSPERWRERFAQEVRAVASLNHPNICTLFDVGPNYLVMELVEGESPKGPLPIEVALNYAHQIASALKAAHEKGVVHCDLKLANIKVKPDGTVKVLDFGLARIAGQTMTAENSKSAVATTAEQSARDGAFAGTAAYMSPEQVRGNAVDTRSDIWSFGVVLYEMVTGRRPFSGESVAEVLGAVVDREPDWRAVPATFQRGLRRCLEKDPNRRLRDIGDVESMLEGAAPPAKSSRRATWWMWYGLAAVPAVGAAIILWCFW